MNTCVPYGWWWLEQEFGILKKNPQSSRRSKRSGSKSRKKNRNRGDSDNASRGSKSSKASKRSRGSKAGKSRGGKSKKEKKSRKARHNSNSPEREPADGKPRKIGSGQPTQILPELHTVASPTVAPSKMDHGPDAAFIDMERVEMSSLDMRRVSTELVSRPENSHKALLDGFEDGIRRSSMEQNLGGGFRRIPDPVSDASSQSSTDESTRERRRRRRARQEEIRKQQQKIRRRGCFAIGSGLSILLFIASVLIYQVLFPPKCVLGSASMPFSFDADSAGRTGVQVAGDTYKLSTDPWGAHCCGSFMGSRSVGHTVWIAPSSLEGSMVELNLPEANNMDGNCDLDADEICGMPADFVSGKQMWYSNQQTEKDASGFDVGKQVRVLELSFRPGVKAWPPRVPGVESESWDVVLGVQEGLEMELYNLGELSEALTTAVEAAKPGVTTASNIDFTVSLRDEDVYIDALDRIGRPQVYAHYGEEVNGTMYWAMLQELEWTMICIDDDATGADAEAPIQCPWLFMDDDTQSQFQLGLEARAVYYGVETPYYSGYSNGTLPKLAETALCSNDAVSLVGGEGLSTIGTTGWSAGPTGSLETFAVFPINSRDALFDVIGGQFPEPDLPFVWMRTRLDVDYPAMGLRRAVGGAEYDARYLGGQVVQGLVSIQEDTPRRSNVLLQLEPFFDERTNSTITDGPMFQPVSYSVEDGGSTLRIIFGDLFLSGESIVYPALGADCNIGAVQCFDRALTDGVVDVDWVPPYLEYNVTVGI